MSAQQDQDEYVRERLEGADRGVLERLAEEDSELGELARRALAFLDRDLEADRESVGGHE